MVRVGLGLCCKFYVCIHLTNFKFNAKLRKAFLLSFHSAQQTGFDRNIESMSKSQLNKCLKSFYVFAREQDRSFFKKTSMKSIRGSIDRYLRGKAGKSFSVVGDPAFHEANKVVDSFLKDLPKTGKIAGILHKKPMTADQLRYLLEQFQNTPLFRADPFFPDKMRVSIYNDIPIS